MTPEELCRQRNERLWQHRQDIAWMPDGKGSVMLRDRPEWTEAHGKRIKQRAERERADWKHRQRYPVMKPTEQEPAT